MVSASSSEKVIEAIKTVRELCAYSLLDAKNAVMTPGMIITTAGTTTRDTVQRRFEALGYAVEFRDP